MRKINTGITGRAVLGTLINRDNNIEAITTDTNIILKPSGTGNLLVDSTSKLIVNNTTDSTTSSTGALTVAGGVGVTGNINSGSTISGPTVTGTSSLNAGSTNGFNATGTYILLPSGDSSSRPTITTSGLMRFNTTYNLPEVYNGSSWVVLGFKDIDVTGNRTTLPWETNWCTIGNITITLPSSSAKGDRIRFFDVNNLFDTQNLTINGANVNGTAPPFTVATEGAAFELVYYNSTAGWRIFTI